MFREIIGNGVFKLLSFKNVRGGGGGGMRLPFSTPRYAPNFLGEQSKNFSFVRATSKSYATPLEVYLLDKKLWFCHLQFIRLR